MYTPRMQLIQGFSWALYHPCLIWAHTLSYLVGILTAGWILCWTDLLLALVCWANLPKWFSPFYIIMASLIFGAIFIQTRESTPSSHISTIPFPGLTIFFIHNQLIPSAQWSQTTPQLCYIWRSLALLESKDNRLKTLIDDTHKIDTHNYIKSV